MTRRPDCEPWRRLTSADTGRRCCATPSMGVFHIGALEAVHQGGRDAGLITVRYPDGVTGAFPMGMVSLLQDGAR